MSVSRSGEVRLPANEQTGNMLLSRKSNPDLTYWIIVHHETGTDWVEQGTGHFPGTDRNWSKNLFAVLEDRR